MSLSERSRADWKHYQIHLLGALGGILGRKSLIILNQQMWNCKPFPLLFIAAPRVLADRGLEVWHEGKYLKAARCNRLKLRLLHHYFQSESLDTEPALRINPCSLASLPFPLLLLLLLLIPSHFSMGSIVQWILCQALYFLREASTYAISQTWGVRWRGWTTKK